MLSLNEIKEMAKKDGSWAANGRVVRVNESRPRNEERMLKNLWENEEVRYMRESFKKKTGFDMADSTKFKVMEDGFSWKKVAQQCGYPSLDIAFKEADSGSNFVQVLRSGVQTIVNNSYQTVPTTFNSWVTTVNSKKDTEAYAPLQGLSFIQEVGKQELYGESRAAGLDIKLRNRKYGTMYAVEKELLEDDQTGQFAQQTALLGEYAKLGIEAIVYAKLSGVAGTYANLSIPATETKPSQETGNYPYTTAFIQGGGANRPSSFGLLNQANIQAGFIGLMNQKNILGLKMQVDPNRIVIGPTYRFDAAVLLNSTFYPSQPGAAGTTGTSFAINPIESIAALTISRFMFKNDGTVSGDSKAWYLMDDKKPWFITQIRNAAEVTSENPNAGESFDRDIIRFKVSMRCNADHIDPRFCWQGNDGTVTA